MDERDWLAERFEHHRSRLRAVALRMLGSASEADDAVQEAWLRLSRSDVSGIEDLGRWLTTVVGRVCLDLLRSRQARREEPLTAPIPDITRSPAYGGDPAQEALLAESVGLALLVVLDTLAPAERLAFVLHDIFAVPYAEIAPLVDRSTAATKMLASRARRRVRQGGTVADSGAPRQRAVVRAFLAASRNGDFDALLALLDPDVIFWADRTARKAGAPADVDGAAAVAGRFCGRARGARLALINGAAGAVWAPGGKPAGAFRFTLASGRIIAIELIGDPERLAQLDLTILADEHEARIGDISGDERQPGGEPAKHGPPREVTHGGL
jgi:RNA polymerase sigma factor (sigma-70 family)